MKKILAFGASSSKKSINKQLANYAASQLENVAVTAIDLNDFEMPIFSVDREEESGSPEAAQKFKKLVNECDGITISLAEHNGSYTAAFKNILDWASRIDKKTWSDKPIFLMATSPGGRGGQTVLGLAKTYFPYMGGKVVATFSLPGFYDNFSGNEGIKNEELSAAFKEQLALFQGSL